MGILPSFLSWGHIKTLFDFQQGEDVPNIKKSQMSTHFGEIQNLFRPVHITINARSESDIDLTWINERVLALSLSSVPQPQELIEPKPKPYETKTSPSSAIERQRSGPGVSPVVSWQPSGKTSQNTQSVGINPESAMAAERARWEQEQAEMEKEMEARRKQSEMARRQRAAEAKSLISHRKNNPKAMFESLASQASSESNVKPSFTHGKSTARKLRDMTETTEVTSENSSGFVSPDRITTDDDKSRQSESLPVNTLEEQKDAFVTAEVDECNDFGVTHTNGYSNGHSNGHVNGIENGHTNGHRNGHTVGDNDVYKNGHAETEEAEHHNGNENYYEKEVKKEIAVENICSGEIISNGSVQKSETGTIIHFSYSVFLFSSCSC